MRLFFQVIIIVSLFLQVQFVIAQDTSTDSNEVKDIAWSPDGTQIAGIYRDSRVAVWSLDNLSRPILTFQTEFADKIRWTPDSQYLIVQGTDAQDDNLIQMSVTKWDAFTGELVDTMMSFHLNTIFEFNPYGYYIFPVLAFDSTATKAAYSFLAGKVYLSDGIQVLHLDGSATNYVHLIEWSPDSLHLAVVYGSSDIYSIQIFNVESGELIHSIFQDLQYYVTDLGWDSTGNYLATSSMRFTCCEGWSNIGVYSVEHDEIDYFTADHWWEEVAHYPAPIDWHPTEFLLAIATTDAIEIYDPAIDDALITIPVEEARDIEWSPDGTQIAGISSAGVLKIWDV
jgi:WD40 repeat protein